MPMSDRMPMVEVACIHADTRTTLFQPYSTCLWTCTLDTVELCLYQDMPMRECLCVNASRVCFKQCYGMCCATWHGMAWSPYTVSPIFHRINTVSPNHHYMTSKHGGSTYGSTYGNSICPFTGDTKGILASSIHLDPLWRTSTFLSHCW